MTPLKAIREKCLDCCCGQVQEVKLCPAEDCSLYPFRFGKNSLVHRTITEEQRISMAENLERARAAKEAKEISKRQSS